MPPATSWRSGYGEGDSVPSGAWRAVPTPDSFVDDRDSSGFAYLRVVEAYYYAVGRLGASRDFRYDQTFVVNPSFSDARVGRCGALGAALCGACERVSNGGRVFGEVDIDAEPEACKRGAADASDVRDSTNVSGSVPSLGRDGPSPNEGVSSGNKLPRGPNFDRNHAARMKKREKKLVERNLRQTKNFADKPKEQKGFWNSCTEEERKLLISTKARMHAAENLRRAKEAEQRASEIGTSFDLASKVVKMVDFAEKQASKEGSSKVYAWASGVANSSAENLAKSVPSSAPSLTALDEKLAASSQSSFELEIMSKDVEIRTLKEKNEAAEDRIERLTDEIYDLKLASQMSDNRFSLLSIAKDRLNKQEKKQSGVTFLNKSSDKKPKFVKTPQQPFEYVKYSPLDYE